MRIQRPAVSEQNYKLNYLKKIIKTTHALPTLQHTVPLVSTIEQTRFYRKPMRLRSSHFDNRGKTERDALSQQTTDFAERWNIKAHKARSCVLSVCTRAAGACPRDETLFILIGVYIVAINLFSEIRKNFLGLFVFTNRQRFCITPRQS